MVTQPDVVAHLKRNPRIPSLDAKSFVCAHISGRVSGLDFFRPTGQVHEALDFR